MSKPNLLAIVTTLFLASAVAGLTAGKSPKTFRCDLRWSADQFGGHALNLVIEEQVDGSFRASVANRFGHRFSKEVPVEDAERFFRRIEAIPDDLGTAVTVHFTKSISGTESSIPES